MTPIERIEHIRQCLRRMNPVLGSELAGAAAIEKELQGLEGIFTRLGEMVASAHPCARVDIAEEVSTDPTRCPACPYPASMEAMTRAALNGDPCD